MAERDAEAFKALALVDLGVRVVDLPPAHPRLGVAEGSAVVAGPDADRLGHLPGHRPGHHPVEEGGTSP